MPIRDPVDIVRALDAFAAEPNGGIVVLPTTVTIVANRDAIIRLAAQHRLPAIYPTRQIVEAGGLMSFGANTADRRVQPAGYVDRLLRGAKVSELPVQFPTKYELVINLKTAKELGLSIPPTLLVTADEVIE
jgi:putative ABC transport system substrate-binding protein